MHDACLRPASADEEDGDSPATQASARAASQSDMFKGNDQTTDVDDEYDEQEEDSIDADDDDSDMPATQLPCTQTAKSSPATAARAPPTVKKPARVESTAARGSTTPKSASKKRKPDTTTPAKGVKSVAAFFAPRAATTKKSKTSAPSETSDTTEDTTEDTMEDTATTAPEKDSMGEEPSADDTPTQSDMPSTQDTHEDSGSTRGDADNVDEGVAGRTGGVTPAEYNPLKPRYDPVADACWGRGDPVPYRAIATVFAHIEDTSGRLDKVAILRKFFQSVIVLSPAELSLCVHMCCNTLAPSYEGVCVCVCV